MQQIVVCNRRRRPTENEGPVRFSKLDFCNSARSIIKTMSFMFQSLLTLVASVAACRYASLNPQEPPRRPGTEEFGLTTKELVQAVEKVEGLIAKCMQKQGFEYVPADFKTVHRGMVSDKSLPGMDESEFVEQYGFGVSTFYTGKRLN